MNPKLLIISDLFGFENPTWIQSYIKLLQTDFHLKFYDSSKLAEIDKTNLMQNELHSQFVHGGIDKAAYKLFDFEKEELNILAFSIGGIIGWKAGLIGLNINHFYAVSSTRLRYESKKPSCSIHLIFGENDPYRPEEKWFRDLNVEGEIIKNGNHESYQTEEVINKLCERIKLEI